MKKTIITFLLISKSILGLTQPSTTYAVVQNATVTSTSWGEYDVTNGTLSNLAPCSDMGIPSYTISTYDELNNLFLIASIDSNVQNLFVYTINTNSGVINQHVDTNGILLLEYDKSSGKTYAVVQNATVNSTSWGEYDVTNGTLSNLAPCSDMGIPNYARSTYDEQNNLFLVASIDSNNQNLYVYAINTNSGVINQHVDTNGILLLEYDESSGKTYAVVQNATVTSTSWGEYDVTNGTLSNLAPCSNMGIPSYTRSTYDQQNNLFLLASIDSNNQNLYVYAINTNSGVINQYIDTNGILLLESVSTTVTTNEELIQHNIKVYPNPVKDYVEISNLEKGSIQILDMSGKKIVQKIIGDNDNAIDMSEHPSGMYIMQIQDKNNSFTLKIVKE